VDAAQCAAAAELLYDLWMSGERIDALPASLRPSTRAEGYAIQAQIERCSGSRLFGWKVAATSAAGQAHIQVDGPLAGRILAQRVIVDGEPCALDRNRMRVAELEFAFRMGQELPPRPQPYATAEVLERVAALHPAIEIPDSRFDPFERAGMTQLIADNACAHDFVLGRETTEDWRHVDLAAHEVWGFLDDGPPLRGVGANVLGDPRLALTWLVNELSRHGISLHAGEIVTTGTCLTPIRIREGQRLRGDFGGFGTVAVRFR
jgi:2-keto-4-pentenoate hydratase